MMVMKGKRRSFVLGSRLLRNIRKWVNLRQSGMFEPCPFLPENDRIADTPQNFQSTA
jgi:hypothetical protein